MVWIRKRNGRREEFKKEKIIRTCRRAGVSREVAEKIAEEVEKRVYDGIPSSKILEMVLELIDEYTNRSTSSKYDLKMALFRLGPTGYEFEQFVARLLKEFGFETVRHVYVSGECVTHEIDVIAKKDGKTYMIECKFHNLPGSYTGLKEVMYTYSRLLDLREGNKNRKNNIKFDEAWLFTNTKFSSDAKRYAKCKGIKLTGWRHPKGESIEKMLEKKGLYPITVLKSLRKKEEEALVENGYIFCKDILKENPEILSQRTGISVFKIKRIMEEIKNIIYKR